MAPPYKSHAAPHSLICNVQCYSRHCYYTSRLIKAHGPKRRSKSTENVGQVTGQSWKWSSAQGSGDNSYRWIYQSASASDNASGPIPLPNARGMSDARNVAPLQIAELSISLSRYVADLTTASGWEKALNRKFELWSLSNLGRKNYEKPDCNI